MGLYLVTGGTDLRCTALMTTCVAIGLGGVATAADIPGLTVHTHWKKFCFNNHATGFKEVCDTRAEARQKDNDSLLAAVELIVREGESKKTLRVTFPLGMQLIPGTRLIVDGSNPLQSSYVVCTAKGCVSDYDATPALLGSMRAGQVLFVQAIDQHGKPFTVTLSLADFWVAYDGPRTEPVVDLTEEPHHEIEAPRKPWLDDAIRRQPIR